MGVSGWIDLGNGFSVVHSGGGYRMISVNMFKALKLDCSTFIKKSYSSCKVNENFYFFQMFEKATEWQDFAPELDEVCENTSGVFSKWKIWDEIDKIEDELEVSRRHVAEIRRFVRER